jgi:chemotaxis protein methyltransferase CheR
MQELFLRAEQEFNRENFRTASQGYDTILRHMPRHVGAMVGKGFILANEGRYEQDRLRAVRDRRSGHQRGLAA